MADDIAPVLTPHGALRLPAVDIESYNTELKDDEGFVGDRAKRSGLFRRFIEEWRKPLREIKQDPFGDTSSPSSSPRNSSTPCSSAATERRQATLRFKVRSKASRRSLHWSYSASSSSKRGKQAERIVVGGGFSGRRVGELAIGRASLILKAEKIKLDIAIIRNNPDEAGLLGAIQLAPPWIFKAHDGVLAVDIGGTNIRAGIVQLNLKRAADLSKAKVFELRAMAPWGREACARRGRRRAYKYA